MLPARARVQNAVLLSAATGADALVLLALNAGSA